jgi:MtN3 and saliva related transmembrane protein
VRVFRPFEICSPERHPKYVTEFVGWASSLILLATVAKQVHKQWVSESSEGVSIWLFIGQMTASAGFTAYSYLVGNWIFVWTNALMLISALVGYGITKRNQRRGGQREGQKQPSPVTSS